MDAVSQTDITEENKVNQENNELTTPPNTVEATNDEDTSVILDGDGDGDEAVDDEANIEGSIESSVQIAPTTNTQELNQDDSLLFVQLGDRVVYDSTKYGRIIGQVYHRSTSLISVKPDGVSNELYDFHLKEDNDEEETYKEEYGVTAVYVIEKRKYESFVEQQDFRINQIIDTFDFDGELYKAYNIVKVDSENDYIHIQDPNDKETTEEINFNFVGISEDNAFKIISIRQYVATDVNKSASNEKQETTEQEISPDNEEILGEQDEPEEEIEIVGFIEIVKPKTFKEAVAYEQRIPDDLQKIDALNDFISSLDPILQKDPKSIRAVRILVETLFNLKQNTVEYNNDGTIQGTKKISVSTLAELIQNTTIPLGRPVLNVSKKLYIVPDEEDKENEDEEVDADQPFEGDDFYLKDFQNELELMIKNNTEVVSTLTSTGGQIIREWANQQNYLKTYSSPFSSKSDSDPLWIALSDSEFFRSKAPELKVIEETNIFTPTVTGYLASHSLKQPPILNKISFGIERALANTYRKGKERSKQILITQEHATMMSYLIFPIKTAKDIGITRSSNLAIDSGRSQMPKETMRNILRLVGEPKEIGTSRDLLLLNVDRNTLGNIPLADYIEGLSVPSLGLGDTFSTLEQYGINNMELTPQIAEVLINKIQLYQNQLLSTITRLREIIDKEAPTTQILNPFLENSKIFEYIVSQPTLAEDLQEFSRINPSLAESDIGQISYLMKKHSDYFQVAIGGNSVLIAKALLDTNNALYLQALKVANILKHNQTLVGEKPIRNTCKHIGDLVSIRRITDDAERFQKLTDFFKKYQGVRDGNWINCNICTEHLLCLHERLQIQIYINPFEKTSIEKEIIIKFSGGIFQGNYICRNCGQPIREIEFDNNVEFDDNGKPKNIAQGQLDDEDTLFEEKLDTLTSAPIEISDNIKLSLNSTEKQIYDVAREIIGRIGVNMDNTGYKNIIDSTSKWISKFPSSAVYAKKKEANPKLPDYDVNVARNIICACGVCILLEIQTKIPPYNVKHVLRNCNSPGFNGYPLDTNKSEKQGLEYIACAISSISRKEPIWTNTRFQTIPNENTRRDGIVKYMMKILNENISDVMILAHLEEKRIYLTKLKDSGRHDLGMYQDIIPPTFLPEQITITPADAAKDAITPEIAATMGNKGKLALCKLWIRQAHALAKKTAYLIQGSPLSEVTCCLSNIESPGIFWKNASDLPDLGRRQIIPNKQGHVLVTEFIPRKSNNDVVKPDPELYYRIFLKYCFQGPRIGQLHEPGLTNICPWCGFDFQTNPSTMDTNTEGKSALASQKINTDTDTFVSLLDKIHTVNDVKPVELPEQNNMEAIMTEFSDINPPPINGWKDNILGITHSFLTLPPDADRGDIAVALGPISEVASTSRQEIFNRLSAAPNLQILLEEIVELSWANFFQVIQAYFITPYQRLITEFNDKSLFISYELGKELSSNHIKQDLEPIINNELYIIKSRQNDIKKQEYDITRLKLKYFVKQLSQLLLFKNKIRQIIVPGRDKSLVYIQRAMLYGPLSTLLNSGPPPDAKNVVEPLADPAVKFLLQLVSHTLIKYNREKLTFNDKQLKELIAIRNEKERVNVIKEFDKLTDEERAVELMNKRLGIDGINKWSVGGTSLIYAYDKDYYDMEREKRNAAGIIDFPGIGPDQVVPLNGRQVDESGFPVFTDANFEGEGGYDHNQDNSDD